MKTQISQNIRKFRLNADMTQEMLAEKLGVSIQAISRWENGATFPDIILLPMIAAVFGVSIDTLFSFDKETAQIRIDETEACIRKSRDHKERIEMARKLCKEFPTLREPRFILFDQLACTLSSDDGQKEAVKLGYELLDSLNSDEYWRRGNIITEMTVVMPEEELEEFLGKYTHDYGLDSMLIRRYIYRGEKEKWFTQYSKTMYIRLRHYFQCFANALLESFDRADARKLAESRIKMINVLSEIDCPIDAVAGDGEVDIFTLWRMDWGIRLAAYHNDEIKAMDILKDVQYLFNKIKEHPTDKALNTRTPLFSPLEIQVERAEDKELYSFVPNIPDIGSDGFAPKFFKHELERPAFDWLRDNEEFKKLTESL